MAQNAGHGDDSPELAVDGLRYTDVGIRLRELADHLGSVADLINDTKLYEEGRLAYEHGHEEAIEEYETELRLRFRRMLSGLGSYRRSYHYWERVIAEFALTEMNYTQRETAHLLGVGLSTINRWAQNPLTIGDDR